ncbi:MAG: 4-hydroxy-3-methylbut-2-enyl diphosphate reductase [Alphaproteobacteria bacterium]|nr:4-hydroxy-3-methylbut-2-enyl diphosphate reductase [Alphaproteobacteria bacterium]
MKKFKIPQNYKSSILANLKAQKKQADPLKKDFSPSILEYKNITFYLARHFGFCYGVENAIEIAFKAIEEAQGKNIYLISEMIHNPQVNKDLNAYGIRFLQNTYGDNLIPFENLKPDDIVIIPAFGTTLETEKKLSDIGVQFKTYNTTCPFVEKVWNRSYQIGKKGFTLLIHGKPQHEETKATFSHIKEHSNCLIVKDINEAKAIGDYILNKISLEQIQFLFKDRIDGTFDFKKHLTKIGVVNQTTQLAFETHAIATYIKKVLIEKFGETHINDHFADTKDTLCYATNDNQNAVQELIKYKADFSLVIGGAKSSNTSHLVELCEQAIKTYFIESELDIISKTQIKHTDWLTKETNLIDNYLPPHRPLKVLITSGASCPDKIVENVINKLREITEN